MADYISREAAKLVAVEAAQSRENGFQWGETVKFTTSKIIGLINSIPAADVRPVVHGKWTMHSDRPDTLICTACDHAFDVWVWDHKWMHFCPHCGADMREEAK